MNVLYLVYLVAILYTVLPITFIRPSPKVLAMADWRYVVYKLGGNIKGIGIQL